MDCLKATKSKYWYLQNFWGCHSPTNFTPVSCWRNQPPSVSNTVPNLVTRNTTLTSTYEQRYWACPTYNGLCGTSRQRHTQQINSKHPVVIVASEDYPGSYLKEYQFCVLTPRVWFSHWLLPTQSANVPHKSGRVTSPNFQNNSDFSDGGRILAGSDCRFALRKRSYLPIREWRPLNLMRFFTNGKTLIDWFSATPSIIDFNHNCWGLSLNIGPSQGIAWRRCKHKTWTPGNWIIEAPSVIFKRARYQPTSIDERVKICLASQGWRWKL